MSGSKGIVRKIFDSGPSAVTSNNNWDGSGVPTTAWGTGITDVWITSLAQGPTDNDRVGFSIAAESLDLTLLIDPDFSANSAGHNVLRVILLADNECDGAAPTPAEFLGNAQQTDTSIATGFIASHIQPGYFGRFHFLMDEYWSWHSFGTTTTSVHPSRPFEHRRHFDLHDHRILWDMSDASAIANARKGHMFLFFFYQSITTGTGGLPTLFTSNPPTIQYSTRLRYRDA